MEIHAPHEPVHSLKDFALHIFIVTIGILIALSLEGIRETIHDRRLVSEARDNFHRELGFDRNNIQKELDAVSKATRDIKALIPALPGFANQTAALNSKLAAIQNPNYFFIIESWQTALSTGALAHMDQDEVGQYAAAEYAIRNYTSLQSQTIVAEDRVKTFFRARPNPNPQELREGIQEILLWSVAEERLTYVADEMQGSINDAFARSSHE